MTDPAETPSQREQGSVQARQSRLFWTATAMTILVILLLCASLILIAAARS